MSTVQINDVEPRVQYVIGSTADAGPFSVPFPFFAKADVVVTTTDGSTVTELVLDSDYTLSGTSVDDGFQNGEVTLTPALSDVTLTIYRRIKIERTADFPQQGPFNIPALNTVIDRLFAIAQEHGLRLDRAITLSYSDSRSDLELPLASENKAIKWKNGALANSDYAVDEQVTFATEWATKAEDSLISTAAGGDGSTDYSALHHAAKAAASESNAAASETNAAASESAAATSETNAAQSATDAANSAASIDLPNSLAGAANQALQVKSDESGYEHIPPRAPASHVGAGGLAQHPAVTGSTSGFMTPSMKSKLDGVEANAEVNTVTSVNGQTGAVTTPVQTDLDRLRARAFFFGAAL